MTEVKFPEVHVIYGGQFGSEAKRLFTEYYANKFKPDAIITNALPNSGGFDSAGDKWSTLPIGYPCKLMISPGSAININNLYKEIDQLPEGASVLIHQHAAVVQEKHMKNEGGFVRIGSTMTGGAAAVFEKMERDPISTVTVKRFAEVHRPDMAGMIIGNDDWISEILKCERILVICAQGHSLSINYGFYPYCTSRNTSPAQAVADSGIPMQWVKRVIGCFRTYPIRVANRYDEVSGDMIGWSGPCYEDQKEISWEDLGLKPEYTSVSHKIRRVFTFSHEQLAESLFVNGTTDIFLNFINYVDDDEREDFVDAVRGTAEKVGKATGVEPKLSFLGYGPTKEEIVEDLCIERV